MSRPKFDPERVIDYSVDYYAVLSLERGCLPEGKNTNEREEIVATLNRAYGQAAKKAHPDLGGSAEAFKLVVRAHTILSNFLYRRVYESGGKWRPTMVEDGNEFAVDWDKIGAYQEGTLADTIGFGLCLNVGARCQELEIVPAFVPSHAGHNYEWDWAVPDMAAKLAISLVEDENDVLTLTDKDHVENSLPFKIYICIPRAAMHFLRGEKERIVYEDGAVDPYILNGKLQGAAYADYNLLETTDLEAAQTYVSKEGNLARDLRLFREGALTITGHKETTLMKSRDMQAMDVAVIRQILRSKAPVTIRDEHGAEFLQRMPDFKEKSKNNESTTPCL